MNFNEPIGSMSAYTPYVPAKSQPKLELVSSRATEISDEAHRRRSRNRRARSLFNFGRNS